MKKPLLLLVAILMASSCQAQPLSEEQLLVRELLKLDYDAHKPAPAGYDSLAEYKKWEALYMKYAKTGQKNPALTYEEAKILLLIGFVAKNNQDAATMESFAGDLVPLFEKNKTVMLNALGELPFLTASTCSYFDRYFGFEDNNAAGKAVFLKKNQTLILEKLGEVNGTACLQQFDVAAPSPAK